MVNLISKKQPEKQSLEPIFLGETDRFSFYLRGSFPDLYVEAKGGVDIADRYYVNFGTYHDWSDEFKGLVIDQLRSCCPEFKKVVRDFNGLSLSRAEGGMQRNDCAVFESMKGYRVIVRSKDGDGGIAEVCNLGELLLYEKDVSPLIKECKKEWNPPPKKEPPFNKTRKDLFEMFKECPDLTLFSEGPLTQEEREELVYMEEDELIWVDNDYDDVTFYVMRPFVMMAYLEGETSFLYK